MDFGADGGLFGISAGAEVEEFATALDHCLSPFLSPEDKKARVLDLPRKFYENATRRLNQARPKRGRSSDVDMDMDEMEAADGDGLSSESAEVKRLEKEVQTWDLIRRLLPLRYNTSNQPPSVTEPLKPGLLNELLEINTVAQERHAVLQWLQSNAASGPDIDEVAQDLLNKANRGDIIAHGWLHTKSAIKLRKGMTAWPHLLDRQQPSIMHSHLNSDRAPLITQLDPDAVTRQGRKLEPADEYFERAIWLGCFEHLRRGSSLDALRDWCQERTELWRAVSMSAMLFQADDKTASEDINPASLALWRRMCFALARQGGSDSYERAVYGVLSGDISSVEKVAKRWDDFLFANYNALLRTQLDTFVLSQCPPDAASSLTQSFPSFDAVQFLGDQEGMEKRLIQSLESQEQVRDEAMEPSKALQAAFIAKDIDHHLYEQGLVMTEDANSKGPSKLLPNAQVVNFGVVRRKYFNLSQHEGLRIVAHIYVLTNLMERLSSPAGSTNTTQPHWSFSQESILAGYTDYLRRAGLQELIPLYCSILQTPRQYEVLSWNLIHEEDPQQRLLQLKLVRNAGIDVLEFVGKQAGLFYDGLGSGDEHRSAKTTFSIIKDGTNAARFGKMIRADFIGGEEGVVDSKHEHVIRSLEWLLMVDGMWPMVFSMGVKAYKFFLRYTHLNAARQLMERVSFEKAIQSATGHEESDELWFDDVETWVQLLERGGIENVRPEQVLVDARNFRELEHLIRGLDNLETVGSLMVISLETTPGDRDFWSGAGPEIKKTKDFIPPLLRGWLVPSIEGGDEELKEIRMAYLPETILAYISALHFAGIGLSRDNLLECMELAAMVAERGSDLADVFIKTSRMTELLESFAACSKALAIATGDKRSAGTSSKRLREMGWSRDVWSVKSGNGDASVRGS
ncbi:Nuclear pore protein NUP84 [Cladobotryum mycophilum]|uniref:Nuclear pore complex protein n=1 Tax=Cladobotryum mycophilum TaxID=491253 RepID=A0ABR0S668_9HYPO